MLAFRPLRGNHGLRGMAKGCGLREALSAIVWPVEWHVVETAGSWLVVQQL